MDTMGVVIYTIMMVIVGLAKIPNLRAAQFKRFWRNFVRWKVERRELKACPKISLKMGAFAVDQMTIPILTDVIANTTLNFALVTYKTYRKKWENFV